jgi:hypothetical protein
MAGAQTQGTDHSVHATHRRLPQDGAMAACEIQPYVCNHAVRSAGSMAGGAWLINFPAGMLCTRVHADK